MTRPVWTRRRLLEAGFAGLGGTLLSGCQIDWISQAGPREVPSARPFAESSGALPWRNWSGDHRCTPAYRAAPESEAQIVSLLRETHGPLRPAGAGHSFSPLVPTEGTLLSLDLLSGIVRIDEQRRQAEIYAGTRLHALGPALAAAGQAFPVLPDIDYQALGGALATSTHGAGAALGSLSSSVAGLTLVTPSGELLECSATRHPEIFHAARTSLGALGVVTRVVLQNRSPFTLREETRLENVDELLENIDHERTRNRHFEFHVFPHSRSALVVRTNLHDGPTDPGEEDPRAVYGLREAFPATLGSQKLYDLLLRNALGTDPTYRSGPSYQVLPHQRVARFREMEYTVAAEDGPACLREVLDTIERLDLPLLMPLEYRYVRGDDVWLSMFHGRDGCSISVHQFVDEAFEAAFAEVEAIFWKYAGRPHWGKLHTLSHEELAPLYSQWADFIRVRDALDPERRMTNDYLRTLLG